MSEIEMQPANNDAPSGRALITGANGFVGRCLCELMSRQGWQVRAAVRSSTTLPNGVEMAVVGDIDDNTDWAEALQHVDVVIHLAARVHVMNEAAADPLAAFLKVNLHGTVNLAEQAVCAGVKRLVYVSSIKVNGEETLAGQIYSAVDTPAPQDPYGVSKWQAEQSLQSIAQCSALEVVVVRPPLVYGPGVKGNFISLLGAIDKGIPLPLASANNARSLVFVGNLADALINCASHPAAAGKTFLISDGKDVSTGALVKKIAVSLGKTSRSFPFPPMLLKIAATILGRSAQIDRLFGSLRVNNAPICAELDWIPPFSLDQGLNITADWYRGSSKP
ncbi:MAG: SDR family oxidoreductase [Gallionella sp.]